MCNFTTMKKKKTKKKRNIFRRSSLSWRSIKFSKTKKVLWQTTTCIESKDSPTIFIAEKMFRMWQNRLLIIESQSARKKWCEKKIRDRPITYTQSIKLRESHAAIHLQIWKQQFRRNNSIFRSIFIRCRWKWNVQFVNWCIKWNKSTVFYLDRCTRNSSIISHNENIDWLCFQTSHHYEKRNDFIIRVKIICLQRCHWIQIRWNRIQKVAHKLECRRQINSWNSSVESIAKNRWLNQIRS